MQAPWVLAYLIIGDRDANVRTGQDRRAAQDRRPAQDRWSAGDRPARRRTIVRRNASRRERPAPPPVTPLPESAAYQGDVPDRARRR
jgi:hypothetical protein